MGTIKTTNIEPIADNGTVTLGSSGDTFTLGSGVVQSNLMNPAFHATLSSNQSLTNNTGTIAIFNAETFDTDSAYDTSTGKFQPQVSGKYFIYASAYLEMGASSNLNRVLSYVQKNGTNVLFNYNDARANPTRAFSLNPSGVIELNGSSDYVQLFVQVIAQTTASGLYIAGGTGGDASFSYFGAYRIGS